MTYQEIKSIVEECRAELVRIGQVELIIPYFFVGLHTDKTAIATMQKMDTFVFLITLHEDFVITATTTQIKEVLIQQMLHTCAGCEGNSDRWHHLIDIVNSTLGYSINAIDYNQLQVTKKERNTNAMQEGYIIAQACVDCGFKGTIALTTPFQATTVCPMCDQMTCVQAA